MRKGRVIALVSFVSLAAIVWCLLENTNVFGVKNSYNFRAWTGSIQRSVESDRTKAQRTQNEGFNLREGIIGDGTGGNQPPKGNVQIGVGPLGGVTPGQNWRNTSGNPEEGDGETYVDVSEMDPNDFVPEADGEEYPSDANMTQNILESLPEGYTLDEKGEIVEGPLGAGPEEKAEQMARKRLAQNIKPTRWTESGSVLVIRASTSSPGVVKLAHTVAGKTSPLRLDYNHEATMVDGITGTIVFGQYDKDYLVIVPNGSGEIIRCEIAGKLYQYTQGERIQ